MSNRIVVTKPIPEAGLNMLREVGRVEVIGRDGEPAMPPDALAKAARGADAILCFVTDPIDAQVLAAAAPTCKVVANFGVGTDNIDIAEATLLGIRVTNTPGVLTAATADLAFGLILAASRGFRRAETMLREGRWCGVEPMQIYGHDVTGATLGIVGAGRIGSAVARRAIGFDMPILYAHPRPVEALDALGGRLCPLDELLENADIVSLHVPLTPTTRGLVGAEELARMKPTAYLVNTARGPVVDEPALIAALRAGRIAGAGLDVFANEPDVPKELLALENVTVLPHMGSGTVESREAIARIAAGNCCAVLEGREPENPVN